MALFLLSVQVRQWVSMNMSITVLSDLADYSDFPTEQTETDWTSGKTSLFLLNVKK